MAMYGAVEEEEGNRWLSGNRIPEGKFQVGG